MARLAFFVFIAIIAFVIFIIKSLVGTFTGSEKLQSTTFKDETKKAMDVTAKGISWMEQQWEQSKKGASGGKIENIYISSAKEINRNDCFIAYDDGTVLDRQTNLMWAATDNGSGINWVDAERYCKNYRGGGYIDWRLPTQNELSGLFLYNGRQINTIRNFIKLTNNLVWTSKTRGADAAFCGFGTVERGFYPQSADYVVIRSLPVRSVQSVIVK